MKATWFRKRKEQVTWEGLVTQLKPISFREHTFVIGSDSQPVRNGEVVVTAICILSKGSLLDRCFFFHRALKPSKSKTLYDRMLLETMQTITVANELRDILGQQAKFELHFDLASCSKGQTYRYTNSLTSIAKGFAFENIQVKPNSWAASSIADRLSKTSRHTIYNPNSIYTEPCFTQLSN